VFMVGLRANDGRPHGTTGVRPKQGVPITKLYGLRTLSDLIPIV
jgi:hypothetical protein